MLHLECQSQLKHYEEEVIDEVNDFMLGLPEQTDVTEESEGEPQEEI